MKYGRVRKKKGHDRTERDGQTKKSQSGDISHIWREAPIEPITTEICVVGSLSDVITYAKFQVKTFRGYDFTAAEFPIFLLIFARATALPVIRLAEVREKLKNVVNRRAACKSGDHDTNVKQYITIHVEKLNGYSTPFLLSTYRQPPCRRRASLPLTHNDHASTQTEQSLEPSDHRQHTHMPVHLPSDQLCRLVLLQVSAEHRPAPPAEYISRRV